MLSLPLVGAQKPQNTGSERFECHREIGLVGRYLFETRNKIRTEGVSMNFKKLLFYDPMSHRRRYPHGSQRYPTSSHSAKWVAWSWLRKSLEYR